MTAVWGETPSPLLVTPDVNNEIGSGWLRACALSTSLPGIAGSGPRVFPVFTEGWSGRACWEPGWRQLGVFPQMGKFWIPDKCFWCLGSFPLPFSGGVAAYLDPFWKYKDITRPGIYSTTSPWFQYKGNFYMCYKWLVGTEGKIVNVCEGVIQISATGSRTTSHTWD